jgi:hypothetical protein
MLSVRLRISKVVLCGLLAAGLVPVGAQDAAAPAAKPVTFLGTVQTLSGNTLTVKSDAGATMQVTVEANARLLRVEPGQKTLAGASPFSLSDLATGDRVMARGAAGADGKSLDATLLVAIKGADIAQKQQQEREDWQKRGTGGLVKSVDAAAGTVTISSGPGGTRTTVIHVSPTTIVRRYAPGSVKFDQAVKSTLDQIKPGDQLRARGSKSADGATLEAEEVVSGSFLNLAGPIQAVNADKSTITLMDTATKKPVVVSVTPDSEVKKLDPAVAQRIAMRLKGGGARPPGGSPAPAGGPPSEATATSGGDRPAGGPGRGPGGSGPDIQQILARAPSVTLKDLQKGNMLMVVATAGETPQSATAVTVVAGVEPMLQASTSASQAMLSSAWNLGGEGSGGGGGETPQ